MSFNVRPKGFTVPALRMAGLLRRVNRFLRIRLYLLIVLAAWTAPAEPPPGILPATRQFEVPQESDPYKLQQIQRMARERTEQFRLRITLPPAAFAGSPARDLASRGRPGGTSNPSGEAPPAGPASFVLKLVWCFLGVWVWVLIARKLSPDLLEYPAGWLRSRMLWRTVPTKQLVALLAEEQAVSEFQAALRAGSRSSTLVVGTFNDAGLAGESRFSATPYILEMRRLLQEAGRSEGAAQRKFLLDVLDRLQSLKNLAKPVDWLPVRRMTDGLELLLKQLTEKSSNVTSSTLRTVNLAVDLVEELCRPGLKLDLLSEPPLRLLVVDDEPFSRFALSNSLKRGLSQPDVAENGHYALALATRYAYDLIVLDVQMPGMDGFELCSRIHETNANRTTPVVFVTSMRDFDVRARSILCGGRDLIAKPFLTFELTVKALTLVAGERLRGRGRALEDITTETTNQLPASPLPDAVKSVGDGGEGVAQREPTPAVEPKHLPLVPATVSCNGSVRLHPEPVAMFFTQARLQIDKVRKVGELALVTPDHRVQQEMITDLFLGVHSLAVSAESAAQHSIALTAAALEGLLKKLLQDPANLSSSTLQSVVTAATLIQDLCVGEPKPGLATAPPIRALVVDDDPVALRSTGNALQRTFSKPQCAPDGESALALAAETPFDVIFLDVQMPDLDGFEVCNRIRENSVNRHTPVIFITGHDTTTLRAQSGACGGNDVLIKPCLASELNLKALSFALRGRLRTDGVPNSREIVAPPTSLAGLTLAAKGDPA